MQFINDTSTTLSHQPVHFYKISTSNSELHQHYNQIRTSGPPLPPLPTHFIWTCVVSTHPRWRIASRRLSSRLRGRRRSVPRHFIIERYRARMRTHKWTWILLNRLILLCLPIWLILLRRRQFLQRNITSSSKIRHLSAAWGRTSVWQFSSIWSDRSHHLARVRGRRCIGRWSWTPFYWAHGSIKDRHWGLFSHGGVSGVSSTAFIIGEFEFAEV
jgi:hypothetical protein